MEEDLKQLLLVDLCARLCYGVKCHFKYGSAEGDITLSCIDNNVARFEYGWYGRFHVSVDADYIKPYLRPMSSMTEEEVEEFTQFDVYANGEHVIPNHEAIDWLNKNHFDYRGLIPKGLAIEVTESNNPYKN